MSSRSSLPSQTNSSIHSLSHLPSPCTAGVPSISETTKRKPARSSCHLWPAERRRAECYLLSHQFPRRTLSRHNRRLIPRRQARQPVATVLADHRVVALVHKHTIVANHQYSAADSVDHRGTSFWKSMYIGFGNSNATCSQKTGVRMTSGETRSGKPLSGHL